MHNITRKVALAHNDPDFDQVEVRRAELPRWVQVPVGLFLGLFMLLCLGGVAALVFSSNEKAPIAAPVLGVVLLFPSLWALAKCVRLITGRKTKGGLLGPRALRTIGWLFLAFPVGGLFTGYIRENPMLSVYQAICDVGIFVGLRGLASVRERRMVTQAEELEARIRLKRFREDAGKTPQELAVFLHDSVPAYYDLEDHNGDLYKTVSLGELEAICSAIGIRSHRLFADEAASEPSISPQDLISRVKSHLGETVVTVGEFEDRVGYFEDRVGYVIGSSLKDVSEVMDWNVDCLRSVCR